MKAYQLVEPVVPVVPVVPVDASSVEPVVPTDALNAVIAAFAAVWDARAATSEDVIKVSSVVKAVANPDWPEP